MRIITLTLLIAWLSTSVDAAEYVLSLDGPATVAPGEQFQVRGVLSGNGVHDYMIWDLAVAGPRPVIYNSYLFDVTTYRTGGPDDFSFPKGALDTGILATNPPITNVHFEAIARQNQTFGTGTLVTLTLTMPAQAQAGEVYEFQALPDIFGLGFDIVATSTGSPLRVGVTASSLQFAVPDADGTLWRTARNTIRLTFDSAVPGVPSPGQVQINELLTGGGFGPDLSANGFTFTLENGNTVLRVRDDATSDLLDHRWYAIRNTGGWPGVAPFEVDYFVLVGDAEGNGTVQYADASSAWSLGLCLAGCGDANRRDMDGDGRITLSDVLNVASRVFGFQTGKPSGHFDAMLGDQLRSTAMTGSAVLMSGGPTTVVAGTPVSFAVIVSVSTLAQFDAVDLLIGVDGPAPLQFEYDADWNSLISAVVGSGPGVHPSEIAVGGFQTSPLGSSRRIGEVSIDTTDLAPGDYTVAVDPTAEEAVFGAVISKLSRAGVTEPISGSATFTIISPVIYVDAAATGLNDGTSWPNAFTKLQNALAAADSNTEIWVAEGTYTPTEKRCTMNAECPNGVCNVPPGTCTWTQPRVQTFQLRSVVALYGGFKGSSSTCVGGPHAGMACAVQADCLPAGVCDVGVGETLLSQRNPAANLTVLSGDLNGDDGPNFANNSENSFHVVTGSGTDATAILDGFSITGGNADYSPPLYAYAGGGVYNESGSPTIRACVLTANSATLGGGAMSNASSTDQTFTSHPVVTSSRFTNNRATESSSVGGAVLNALSSAEFLDCEFSSNSAGTGGAVSNLGGAPAFTGCMFHSNTAGWGGGAVDNSNGVNTSLIRCSFVENSAFFYGGAMINDESSTSNLINCSFFGNFVGFEGGGIFAREDSSVTMANCVFSGNSASYRGGAMETQGPTTTTVATNCSFSENSAEYWGGGVSLLGGQALFTNCVFWQNRDSGGMAESAQVYSPAGSFTGNYCAIQGLTGELGGTGNIDQDPLFVDPDGADNVIGTADDDLRLASGSPCIDVGDNGAVTESTDLDGNARLVDGDGDGKSTVDMGAYEFFPDCNLNGVPDAVDILNETSADVDGNGVPDECSPFTGGCAPSNDWSCFDNWNIPGDVYPDDVVSAPGIFVTLDSSVDVFLDVDATIPALRILDNATLHVSQSGAGDLTVISNPTVISDKTANTEKGIFIEGSLLSGNDRSIDVPLGTVRIGPNGRYAEDPSGDGSGCSPPTAGNACSTLSAARIEILPGHCAPPLRAGGSMELTDSMSVFTTGDVVLAGDPQRDCDLQTAGITEPPKLQLIHFSRMNVGGIFSMTGAVEVRADTLGESVLSGNFDNRATFPSLFNWTNGKLTLNGSGQVFEVAGVNLGQKSEGFATDVDTLFDTDFHSNFSMEVIEISGGATVTFANSFPNTAGGGCAEALYVHQLILRSGSTVTLDNCDVFYGTLLNEGATRVLLGCAELLPIVLPPIPGDFDRDGDVDLLDHAAFVLRMNGPFEDPTLAGWHLFDLDPDYDVDLHDFAYWQNALTGARSITSLSAGPEGVPIP